MKIKYYKVLAFLSIVLLFVPNNVWAQKEKSITVESVVSDGEGNPIENAQVFGGSGYTITDRKSVV